MNKTSITKEERQSLKGKFVRLIGDTFESDRKELKMLNNLLIVEEDRGDEVVVTYKYENGTSSWKIPRDDFEKNYTVESAEVIETERSKILAEAQVVQTEIDELNETLERYASINSGGDVPNAELPSQNEQRQLSDESPQSEEPAKTNSAVNNPISLARNIGRNVADLRDAFRDKEEKLSEYVKKIKALEVLRTYQMELLLQVKSKLKKIEKVLQTINLYLGSGEEIIQLQQGRWADKSEKLHIRQLILFCDEESQILIEEGGMDFKYLEDFDNWLISNEKHILQIIPEQKCIVALKPRRKMKDYGSDNPYFESKMEQRNKQSCILIRHGENLFRIAPDWAIGNRFFPTQKEMDEHFIEKDFNWKTHNYETIHITPEHRSYQKCLEKFNESHLHYRNSLVLLQGIIDRTGIFPDLQERGVNLLWKESFQDEIVLIHDADESKLLRTGKETFAEYQKRLNGHLEAGHRIILGSLYSMEYKESRYFPKYASHAPDREQIYTLEKHETWDFCIRYENDYSNTNRRATLGLRQKDDFILAFDLATAAEMDEFLNDRLSRPDYLNYLPMLKRIRNLKSLEERAEEPFVLMLASRMMQVNTALEQTEAVIKAKEFLKWWKFKNKVHRALDGKEAKALKQIISEYQQTLTNEVKEFDLTPFLNERTLLLYQRGRKLVRLGKYDHLGILLNKTEFSWKGEWKETSQEIAVTYRQDLPKAEIHFEHPDWKRWGQGREMKKIGFYWTQAEIKFIVDNFDKYFADLEKYLPGAIQKSYHDHTYKLVQYFPLALRFKALENSFEVLVYLEKLEHPSMACQIHANIHRFCFGFDGYRIEVPKWNQGVSQSEDIINLLQKGQESDAWFQWKESYYYGKLFTRNLPRLLKAQAAVKKHNDEVDRLFQEAEDRVVQMRQHFNKILEDEAIQKYLNNFGDMRNWQSHRNRAGIKFVTHEEYLQIRFFAQHLWADNERFPRSLFVGKTLEEMQTVWNQSGISSKNAKEDVYWKKLNDRNFPERLLMIDKNYILFPEEERK